MNRRLCQHAEPAQRFVAVPPAKVLDPDATPALSFYVPADAAESGGFVQIDA